MFVFQECIQAHNITFCCTMYYCLYAACDKACKDSCTGDGPGMCNECADGYELNEEEDLCNGQCI